MFLIVFFTVPFVMELMVSLLLFNENKTYIPRKNYGIFRLKDLKKFDKKMKALQVLGLECIKLETL